MRFMFTRLVLENTWKYLMGINILASGIGSLTNASKIEATFRSVIQSDISLNTIRAYIDHLKDAFIVNEVNRYDAKGSIAFKIKKS